MTPTVLIDTPSLTNFDKGLHAIDAHLSKDKTNDAAGGAERSINLLTNLIDINRGMVQRVAELKESKHRWNIARKTTGVLTGIAVLGELGAVCVDTLIIEDERNAVYWVKASIVISFAVMGIFFAITTGIFHCVFENRYKRHRRVVKGISPEDKAALEKLQHVISSIGALESEKNTPRSSIELKANYCFNRLKDFRNSPRPSNYPDPDVLTSVAIEVLPDEHPIKQIFNSIVNPLQVTDEDEEIHLYSNSAPTVTTTTTTSSTNDSPPARPFTNTGQTSILNLLTNGSSGRIQRSRTTRVAKERWKNLERRLDVYLNELTHDGQTFRNPLREENYLNLE